MCMCACVLSFQIYPVCLSVYLYKFKLVFTAFLPSSQH